MNITRLARCISFTSLKKYSKAQKLLFLLLELVVFSSTLSSLYIIIISSVGSLTTLSDARWTFEESSRHICGRSPLRIRRPKRKVGMVKLITAIMVLHACGVKYGAEWDKENGMSCPEPLCRS